MEVPIQINGKTIHGFGFNGLGLNHLEGMYIEKVVVIPEKLINIVAYPMNEVEDNLYAKWSIQQSPEVPSEHFPEVT